MPELPEVETIINDLRTKILNKRIKKIEIGLKKQTKPSSFVFKRVLLNNLIININRRGKYIIAQLEKCEKYLVIHLRMTGQIIYKQGERLIAGGHSEKNNNFNLPNKYTHVVIVFEDGSNLFYNDQRQFGYLEIVDDEGVRKINKKIGIEPLDISFTLTIFKELLKNKNSNIKSFLLNQKYIAGLGNIYVDEALFAAGVLPGRRINTLKEKEVNKIFLSIKKILKKAINNRGTTFNDYVDANGNRGDFLKMLQVYGRDGKECRKCKSVIKKTRIAGRGTRYCEKCQV